MSVVFPPPPMIAVTPGWIFSASDSFIVHTTPLYKYKNSIRALPRQEYRNIVDNGEYSVVKF